jgi:hypothetical protein
MIFAAPARLRRARNRSPRRRLGELTAVVSPSNFTTGANGENSATWKAALAVNVQASAVAGPYPGVITCSVS